MNEMMNMILIGILSVLGILAKETNANETGTKSASNSLLLSEGDYLITTVYGCAGESGRDGHADVCNRAVHSPRVGRVLYLPKKGREVFHVLPDLHGHYYIGKNCDRHHHCKYYWTWSKEKWGSNLYLSKDHASTAFKLTKRGTSGGYRIQVMDNCDGKGKGPYPCGYEVSFKNVVWYLLKLVKENHDVNFKFTKVSSSE